MIFYYFRFGVGCDEKIETDVLRGFELGFYGEFRRAADLGCRSQIEIILPILPKSMRTEYADSVWRSLEAAIEPGDDATVASSDNVDDIDSDIRKLMMKLITWHVSTERVIAVLSEFVPGYRPTKRFPASCVKRRGP